MNSADSALKLRVALTFEGYFCINTRHNERHSSISKEVLSYKQVEQKQTTIGTGKYMAVEHFCSLGGSVGGRGRLKLMHARGNCSNYYADFRSNISLRIRQLPKSESGVGLSRRRQEPAKVHLKFSAYLTCMLCWQIPLNIYN